jgi:hypothetical protein
MPIQRAGDAHKQLVAGEGHGKIVLTV